MADTRSYPSYVYRRRQCIRPLCAKRYTTVELRLANVDQRRGSISEQMQTAIANAVSDGVREAVAKIFG